MSEPVPGGSPADSSRFEDNPNVLFEAGMFQMLHQLRDDPADSEVARWIPVREAEELTTDIPFDFAADRIVIVPRESDSGQVDPQALAGALRDAVSELTQLLGIES